MSNPTSTSQTQEDLINFVKDPKNIAKAVQGSMDKRNKVMNPIEPSNKTTQEEIETPYGLIRVHILPDETSLHEVLSEIPEWAGETDTIAYTHTYSEEENDKLIADQYYIADVEIDTIAHECTHTSLGVMNRYGYNSVECTTDVAPEEEEYLARIIGVTTGLVASKVVVSQQQSLLDRVEQSLPKHSDTGQTTPVWTEWDDGYTDALTEVGEALKKLRSTL